MLRSTASFKKLSFLFLAFCMIFLLAAPLQASAKPRDEPKKPGKLTLSSLYYEVNENQGSITITVHRIGGKDGVVSVKYCNCSLTAKAGEDFNHVSGVLVFGDGETKKTITVPIVDDSKPESPEGFSVYLKEPTGGATLGLFASFVTIRDNDKK
ncbi:Calx-beta domain-containing protein [Paenibacillus sp. CF384]|uniref:Calx-beta domain-containing protein n=1 Tax=Paenibacillus sp. CF384 TaxID=1884382 RepID=UPI000894FC09|nr:Calx-beta domain-containing protein [Paenibacillus sp. CF384]SDX46205.1 Calx-beta domain-containing protein [Paenibacillus sp. CF384]